MISAAIHRTANAVRLHRSIGIATRRHRLPRQVYPKLIELEYAKAMIGVLRETGPALAPLLHELPALLASAVDARARTDAGESMRARELLEQAKRHMQGSLDTSRIESLAERFADRTQQYNRIQLQRQIRAGLGVDVLAHDRQLPSLVEHFVGENAALIKSIPAQVMGQIEALVHRAFTDGTAHPALAKHIEQRFEVGESRARLIARDQVGKLYGQVNATRQQNLGITSFVWRTAGDERVRPEHDDLDGETFSYDDPPSEGLPGEPVQCRCYAEPVLDDVLGAASSEDDAGTQSDRSSAGGDGSSGEDLGDVAGAPPANPRRVEAARKAGIVSAERKREIHSAVKSNLAPELHVAWEAEGHKFMREEASRIKGVKDRINAASTMSQAFAEKYGSGAETVLGNEGDRYFKRAELEAKHAESWASDQERHYYADMEKAAREAGDIDERGELTDRGRGRMESDLRSMSHVSKANDDDPPF